MFAQLHGKLDAPLRVHFGIGAERVGEQGDLAGFQGIPEVLEEN